MAYQLPQTYPFACPQAKHTDSLSERGLKAAGTQKFKTCNQHLRKSKSQKHTIPYPSLATKFI